MLTPSDVYTQFLLIAEPSDDKETQVIVSLCKNGLDWVMKHIREDISRDDIRISQAAAGIAYYDFALSKLTDSSDPRYFKAGDITVQKKIQEDIMVAEKIKQARLDAIADILEDNSFGAWNV